MKPLPLGMLKEVAKFALSFTDSLDGPEEAEEYRVMPKLDLKDVEFEFRATKSGLAYIGKIAGATAQRGEGTFPNEIVSPPLGRSPWATALGSVWLEAELNHHPVYRRERATEIMRRLCVGMS